MNYDPEDYQPTDDRQIANEQAQELANKIKRQTVITKQFGLYVVYGRKEYYATLPCDPQERSKKNRTIEFVYPE